MLSFADIFPSWFSHVRDTTLWCFSFSFGEYSHLAFMKLSLHLATVKYHFYHTSFCAVSEKAMKQGKWKTIFAKPMVYCHWIRSAPFSFSSFHAEESFAIARFQIFVHRWLYGMNDLFFSHPKLCMYMKFVLFFPVSEASVCSHRRANHLCRSNTRG